MPRRASSSARSFHLWPEWPYTCDAHSCPLRWSCAVAQSDRIRAARPLFARARHWHVTMLAACVGRVVDVAGIKVGRPL